MSEIPSQSKSVLEANRPEGSNPFLTALANGSESDKTLTSSRFWSKVQIGEPLSCWPWTAAVDHSGYGRFSFNKKTNSAHRFAFVLTNGAVPSGLMVLHRCDNPLCCNPAHLFAGTHQDNMADRLAKGRTPKGQRNGRSKLTPDQVQEIRDWRKFDASFRSIATRFGIHEKVVRDICAGKLWRAA